MQFIPANIRGPLFMIVSTGSYLVNDTMMKLATAGLPPYEVLLLRGAAATLSDADMVDPPSRGAPAQS